jgi:hypothetical protein
MYLSNPIKLRLVSILGLCALLFGSVAQAQVRLDLALCIDGSGSISGPNFTLQVNGTANALDALVPTDGSVRLSVYQFSTTVQTVLTPTTIGSPAALANATAAIRAMTQLNGNTAIGDCINTATAGIKGATPASQRSVIDVSTDGNSNTGASPASASAAALTAGISALNFIAIGTGVNIPALESIVFPQPPGGDEGFVVAVADFTQYETAIARKLEQEFFGETRPVPVNNSLALLLMVLLVLSVAWYFRPAANRT